MLVSSLYPRLEWAKGQAADSDLRSAGSYHGDGLLTALGKVRTRRGLVGMQGPRGHIRYKGTTLKSIATGPLTQTMVVGFTWRPLSQVKVFCEGITFLQKVRLNI